MIGGNKVQWRDESKVYKVLMDGSVQLVDNSQEEHSWSKSNWWKRIVGKRKGYEKV